MGRGIGEDLVHCGTVLRLAQGLVLEEAAADEAAHRMGHEVDLEVLRLDLAGEADLLAHARDQGIEATCVVLDLRSVAVAEGGGDLVVVAVIRTCGAVYRRSRSGGPWSSRG